jgi:CRP-like cAMP-binding protein
MASLPPPARPLVLKLESITDLTPQERQALESLPMRVQEVRADQDLVREGDKPSQCCLLIEGFACRYKLTHKGKRQIFAFHTPGDMPDALSLQLKTMDHSVGTLTRCKVGFIQHEHMRELLRQHPRLTDVFWRDTLIDAAIFREWMLGIGRRDAKTRVAHLLCEMFKRLQAVGQEANNAVPLPLTQAEMGDALGLSTVHINRTLQDLRAEKLIEWENGLLSVLDWNGLVQVGEFDETYLHQDSKAVA